jgi:hypothetical protein
MWVVLVARCRDQRRRSLREAAGQQGVDYRRGEARQAETRVERPVHEAWAAGSSDTANKYALRTAAGDV